MKSHLFLFSSVLLFVAAAAFGQPANMTVVPAVRNSPAEQFALASQLHDEVLRAETEDARAEAVARVAAHLEMIPMNWPNDREAVLQAYLQQADLFIENHWTKNARMVLEKARPLAERAGRVPLVDLRDGTALERLGDGLRAKEAFDAATAQAAMKGLTVREQADVLRNAAQFYERSGARADAATRLDRAAQLDLPALERAQYRLFAARARKAAGDRAGSRQDAQRSRDELSRARANAVRDPASYDVMASIERELDALQK
ncbi:MAG TPA: hypothetical protein VKB93_27505 [Thermoanaerobaculia bacterium]|nr:hypothetical protein [Thermoanaerobaculia bacterium]